MTAPLPVREYANEAEMRSSYLAIQRRTFAPRHVEPKAPAFVERELPSPAPDPTPIPPPSIEVTRAAYRAVQQDFLAAQRARRADDKTMIDYVRITAVVTGISVDELKGKCRSGIYVKARWIAMFLMVGIGKRSLPQVGRFLGGRDHTTILHGCRRAGVALRAHPIVSLSDPVDVAQHLWGVSWPKGIR